MNAREGIIKNGKIRLFNENKERKIRYFLHGVVTFTKDGEKWRGLVYRDGGEEYAWCFPQKNTIREKLEIHAAVKRIEEIIEKYKDKSVSDISVPIGNNFHETRKGNVQIGYNENVLRNPCNGLRSFLQICVKIGTAFPEEETKKLLGELLPVIEAVIRGDDYGFYCSYGTAFYRFGIELRR